MKAHILLLQLALTAWLFLAATIAPAAENTAGSADALIRLKKAGIDDRTLEILTEEKILETAAFSVDELIRLKAAGFGSATLQALIRSRSFMRDREPIIYGADIKPIRLASVKDLIDLKEAGMSDAVIAEIIRWAADPEITDRERAYRLLDGLEVRIDTRPDR